MLNILFICMVLSVTVLFLPLNYAHHNYLTSFSNALFQFPLVALEDIAKL